MATPAFFHSNPALVLIESGGDGAVAFLAKEKQRWAWESVAHLTELITDLAGSREANSMEYSPLFQSYTSLPFFASLLAESLRLVTLIDQKPKDTTPEPARTNSSAPKPFHVDATTAPWVREAFWSALYCVVGAKKQPSADLLEPALEAVRNPTKGAQSDHENTAKASTATNGTQSTDGSNEKPWKTTEELQEQTKKLCTEFFNYIRLHSTSPYRHNISVHQLRLLKPNSPTNAPSSNNGEIASQLMQQQEIRYINAVQQIMTLQHWSPALDQLPADLKQRIWEACGNISSLKGYQAATTFKSLVGVWAVNPFHNMNGISGLFSAITMLQQNKILPDNFQQINLTTEKFNEMLQSFADKMGEARSPKSPLPFANFPLFFTGIASRSATPLTTPYRVSPPPGVLKRPGSAPTPALRAISPFSSTPGSGFTTLSNLPPISAIAPSFKSASGANSSGPVLNNSSAFSLRTSGSAFASRQLDGNTKKRKADSSPERADKGSEGESKEPKAKVAKVAEDSTPRAALYSK